MIGRWWALSLTVVLAVSLAGRAQTSPLHSPAKDDYSQEPAIIEEMATKIAFDNDGTSVREQTSRDAFALISLRRTDAAMEAGVKQ